MSTPLKTFALRRWRPGTGWASLWRSLTESLRARVAVVTVAFLVALTGLTALLLVYQSEVQVHAAVRLHDLDEAVQIASLLSHDLIKRQRMLALAAENLRPGQVVEQAEAMRFLEEQSALLASFTSVSISRPDGTMLALRDLAGIRRMTLQLADRPYFRTTVTDMRPVVSDVMDSKTAAGPVIVFAQPVLHAGRLVAVLAASQRLRERSLLSDVASDRDKDSDPLVQLIVSDSAGRILAHSDPAWLLQQVSQEPSVSDAWIQWQAMGAPVEPLGIGLDGPRQLVSVAGVEASGWLVWRIRSRSTVEAPIEAARAKVAGWIGVLALLAGSALVLWLWRLFRPLDALAERAKHLFETDLSVHKPWPQFPGEIGNLAHVLHHVAAERAQLEAFNSEILRKLQSVMNAAPVGIAFTRNQRFELVSAEFCRIFGRATDEFNGQAASAIFASNEDYALLGKLVPAAFEGTGAYVGDWRMLRADGSVFWGQLRGRPELLEDPGRGTIWTVVDVSQQVSDREDLEWSASHDPLTGLGNRKYFHRRAQRLIDNFPSQPQAALIAIDLDHFKPVNDTGGHAAGDAMLKAIATLITGCVRGGDLVARMGGDEFAVLLENCSEGTATRIAGDIQLAIAGHVMTWEGNSFAVGASQGIIMLSAAYTRPGEWYQAADAACYTAKQSGRGRFVTGQQILTRPH